MKKGKGQKRAKKLLGVEQEIAGISKNEARKTGNRMKSGKYLLSNKTEGRLLEDMLMLRSH